MVENISTGAPRSSWVSDCEPIFLKKNQYWPF